MPGWKTLSSKEIYKNPWIRVRQDQVLNHAGKELTYGVVDLNHPSVFIVAANAQGQIYLLQNYRYTINKTMWEIPAGHSDGEDYLAAAKRELMEEAGLVSDDWINLGMLYQANGIGNIPFVAFLAKNAIAGKGDRDKDEQITNGQFFDLNKIEQMAKDGELIESAHIACLYLAKLHGL
jgi:8-oxo-dGTP pyrophosphatase MutT (NUDIX family)